jgi:hypothetical protein
VSQDALTVVNIIVADPSSDPPPEGCALVGIVDGEPCDIGWIYDPATNTFSDPNPPPPEGVTAPEGPPTPPKEVEV